jgi:hypothetical protein
MSDSKFSTRQAAFVNYILSAVIGLGTLFFSTVAVTYGFLPLLGIKKYNGSDWLAAIATAGCGLFALEGKIYFDIFFDRVKEHRNQKLFSKKDPSAETLNSGSAL